MPPKVIANTLPRVHSFAADGPFTLAFSPDRLEVHVAGHQTSDLIDRFRYSEQTDTWTATTPVTTPSSLGGIVVVP